MIVDRGIVVSSRVARDFAQNSTEFENATESANSVTFNGVADDWNVDATTCTVAWHDIAVTFLITGNNSQYTLVIVENPTLGVVYNASAAPSWIAAPPQSSSRTYSGYALAANSGATNEVNYSSAEWVVPTISEPSGFKCRGDAFGLGSSASGCGMAAWVAEQHI